MTVNDLITASLRRIRVISGSDPPDGDTINDSLLRLNDWIDDLKNETGLDLFVTSLVWPLVPGQASYTVGPGLNVPIPYGATTSDISNIGYQNLNISPTYEYQLSPPLSEDAWASIPQKGMTAQFPYYWYYRQDGVLFPWPIPTGTNLKGIVYYSQKLAEVTLTTVVSWPPGYRRFIRDGLALELCAEFHVADPGIVGPLKESTEDSRAKIKRKGRTPTDLVPSDLIVMFGGDRAGNIYTGP